MTSIENVFEELEEQGLVFKSANNLLHISIDANDYLDIKRLCKEMHKQEIENAYWDGGQDIPMSEKSCEQYYQETFKKD
jgi:DNA-binding transcriptional regulator YhcF (GntR family)